MQAPAMIAAATTSFSICSRISGRMLKVCLIQVGVKVYLVKYNPSHLLFL